MQDESDSEYVTEDEIVSEEESDEQKDPDEEARGEKKVKFAQQSKLMRRFSLAPNQNERRGSVASGKSGISGGKLMGQSSLGPSKVVNFREDIEDLKDRKNVE